MPVTYGKKDFQLKNIVADYEAIFFEECISEMCISEMCIYEYIMPTFMYISTLQALHCIVFTKSRSTWKFVYMAQCSFKICTCLFDHIEKEYGLSSFDVKITNFLPVTDQIMSKNLEISGALCKELHV